MNKLEILKKKILYRSNYRGTKEMDILLSGFVKTILNTLNESELIDLEKFLDLEDDIIYDFYQNGVSNKELDNNDMSKLFKKFKV